ncbi:MAG: molybdopterin molybdotransferase MoeA [Desulfocapsaceae bacterium]|nr:molybdopterin molybdotransferase MoeA [Desulfocapsaceae bacterium]
MNNNLTLEQARKRIISHISRVATEKVLLTQAVGRVCGVSYRAPYALPGYNQSLYDGYALSIPERGVGDQEIRYRLSGEIAAGDNGKQTITPGCACRIMTGALVPRGTWKIVPQERCVEQAGHVVVAKEIAVDIDDNIRKKGSRLRKGTTVASHGKRLTPMHLARLADFGVDEVEVYRLPKVHYFCTGSELVDKITNKQPGKKFSSNRFQLAGLIQQAGALGVGLGSVEDKRQQLESMLTEAAADNPAMIISTGGMGPGKYDLLEETFQRVGGKTVFSALRLRPGKSVLFGILGNSLYFGLPGPPPAVHALFYALIRPALMAAGGESSWKPKTVHACLESDIVIAKAETLSLHEGMMFQHRERCLVRLPSPTEIPNCYLLCQAGRKNFRRGSVVAVLPFSP